MAPPTRKLNSALRALEASRVALEKEQRRLAKSGTRKDKKEIAALLDKVDATEFQLLNLRESLRMAARPKEPSKKVTGTRRLTTKGRKASRPRQRVERFDIPPPRDRDPVLVGARELSIRGFWDRYPKSEQKRYPKKFKAFPAKLRRGPTAFDLLQEDLMRFTPAERKRLQIRVAYGVHHETGKIITPGDVGRMGLELDLSLNTVEAINGLRGILIRAGLAYAPIGWDDMDEDSSVPLGVEWWLV